MSVVVFVYFAAHSSLLELWSHDSKTMKSLNEFASIRVLNRQISDLSFDKNSAELNWVLLTPVALNAIADLTLVTKFS